MATSTIADDSGTEEFQLFTVGAKVSSPITADLCVDGQPLTMEVDTGAALSLISEKTYKKMFPEVCLQKSNTVLRTYTEERMTVLGEMQVEVQYGQQREHLDLIVVAGEGPSLLGRNWLRHIRLDWHTIGAVAQGKNELNIDKLLEKHSELFRDELRTINTFQASLQVRPDARPKFFKPRPVPFAIKSAIEQELDRLEASGAIEKVTCSD